MLNPGHTHMMDHSVPPPPLHREEPSTHQKRGLPQETVDIPKMPAKRRKLCENHSETYPWHPPPAYWDGLSKLYLERSTLRELDRRNNESSCHQSPVKTQVTRPRTRNAVRKAKQKAELDPAPDYLSKAFPADLRAIRALSHLGGPDLTDLRGFQQPFATTMYSGLPSARRRQPSNPQMPATSTKTKTTLTAYDAGFEQHLEDHGIYLDNRAETPENLEEIIARLDNPRRSLSPSRFPDTAFQEFRRNVKSVKGESDVMRKIVPAITGADHETELSAGNLPLGNLKPLTDGTLGFAKPDLYYGSRPSQLNYKVREELNECIVPSTFEDRPMAPNFFFEAKGPTGGLAVMYRQATYDGAMGARGLQKLQSYAKLEDTPVYDNKAYTLTTTWVGGSLEIYAVHITKPSTRPSRKPIDHPHEVPEYHTTFVGAYAMTHRADRYLEGARAFRNARDWAREQRDQFVEAANRRASQLAAEQQLESSDDEQTPTTVGGKKSEYGIQYPLDCEYSK